MTRPPRRPRTVYVPPPPEPALSPAQLDEIAALILAGDVYRAGSVPECAALLAVLRARGYVPKRRTDKEQHDAPWLIVVVEELSK